MKKNTQDSQIHAVLSGDPSEEYKRFQAATGITGAGSIIRYLLKFYWANQPKQS